MSALTQSPTKPVWWPADVPYTPMPAQLPYELLSAVRSTWPASGDANLINAATNMSDDELINFLATHNTGSPQWEQQAREYKQGSDRPTVDLQRFWNDAYYRDQVLAQQGQQQQFTQNQAMANLAANPRNYTQYLMAGGNAGQSNVQNMSNTGMPATLPTQASVGAFLNGTPMVQRMYQNAGLPQPPTNLPQPDGAGTISGIEPPWLSQGYPSMAAWQAAGSPAHGPMTDGNGNPVQTPDWRFDPNGPQPDPNWRPAPWPKPPAQFYVSPDQKTQLDAMRANYESGDPNTAWIGAQTRGMNDQQLVDWIKANDQGAYRDWANSQSFTNPAPGPQAPPDYMPWDGGYGNGPAPSSWRTNWHGPRDQYGNPSDPNKVTAGQGMNEQTGQPSTYPLFNQPASQPPNQVIGGSNPDFPFMRGRNLDVRQTLRDFATKSPNIDLTSSLFSFSGQDPANAWGDWQDALPQGQLAAPTRMA